MRALVTGVVEEGNRRGYGNTTAGERRGSGNTAEGNPLGSGGVVEIPQKGIRWGAAGLWQVSEIEGLISPKERKFQKCFNRVMLYINGKLMSSRLHIGQSRR